jgi:hypothetical protein
VEAETRGWLIDGIWVGEEYPNAGGEGTESNSRFGMGKRSGLELGM